VVPRVRALQAETSASGANDAWHELRAVIEEMRAELEGLRERNAALVDRLDDAAAPDGSESDALHPETEALLEQLEVSSVPEARERVESLNDQLDALYREKEQLAEAGLMSAQEALDEIDRLQKKCDRLQSGGDGAPSSMSSAASAPSIADVLGIETVADARELDETVRRMAQRLQDVREERAVLRDELGVARAEDVLDLVRSMEQQLSTLYDAQSNGQSGSPSEDVEGLPSEAGTVLGVSTVEEARDLRNMVQEMSRRLEDAMAEYEKLDEAGLTVDTALAMIESMEQQLVALYEEREKDLTSGALVPGQNALAQSVEEVLGCSTPEEVEQLNDTVRRMSVSLDELRDEQKPLAEAGLSSEHALRMLENMEAQLNDLYETREERWTVLSDRLNRLGEVLGVHLPADTGPEASLERLTDEAESLLTDARAPITNGSTPHSLTDAVQALTTEVQALASERDEYAGKAEELASLKDALGIASAEEAEELASLAQNMSDQLEMLYEERAKLQEVGLSSVESAVDMIKNMGTQLDELYEEQESLLDRPTPTMAGQQDTFEQLQSLYTEREKLERALGVSSAEDVIEMVEALTAQLDDLYADREGRTPSWFDDDTGAVAPPDTGAQEGAPAEDASSGTLSSLQSQLESLYEEKQALLDRGIPDAQEAAERIDELEDRIGTLQQERDACHEQLAHLEDALGTADATEIVDMVEGASPSGDGSASRDAAPSVSPPAEDEGTADRPSGPPPSADDIPPVLPADTLEQLDALSDEELEGLSVGAIQLDDDGRITALNEASTRLPGLDAAPSDLVGTSLFRAVPSTTNTVFLDRFRAAVESGTIDDCFPYTFVSPQQPPTAFYVHLYRGGPDQPTWLLLKRV
jgi:photoactive yellow protein